LKEGAVEHNSLFAICGSAFLAVFVLLAVLSAVMKLIIYIFPEKAETDAAVIAAVASTISRVFPGTKITKIERV